MSLVLYNSLSKRKEVFQPLDPERVTLYACGPTVYNPPHIGNARAAVVYDLLFRVLQRHYPNVIYARNITDVDDKINAAAAAEGVPIATITERYAAVYHADVAALGVLPPTLEPRATAHIEAMISMIGALIERNHAYEAAGHVMFHVPGFPAYGALSGRAREDMIAGARVEVAPFKKDPADFVLWKPSDSHAPGWDSPWGRGRPGWHIECSAMIAQHLGRSIDIHGGGNDLKFPHHENEVAQSYCAHDGTPLSRFWLHNGFVEINSEKMSKSIGNVLLVRELLESHPGEAIRLALLRAKYREPLSWSSDLVVQAKNELDRLYGALERTQSEEDTAVTGSPRDPAFDAAMDDDLNSPLALSLMMGYASALNRAAAVTEQRLLRGYLIHAGRELGLLQSTPESWFRGEAADEEASAGIEQLVAQRTAARNAKNWAEADSLREQLEGMGIEILDTPDGTQWRKA